MRIKELNTFGIYAVLTAMFFLLVPSGSVASNTVTLTLFEPEGFYRDTAGPETAVRSFTIPAIQGNFTLYLDNGSASGDSLVSSAVITVNGTTVVKTSDLSQQVTHLERDLAGIVNEGENTLEVEVRSIPSSYITVCINGVYLLDVQITDPFPPTTIDSDRATVKGTWEAYTGDVGVVVNGVPAALSGNVFVASDVALVAGANTLTATITTFEEISDTALVQVTASGEEPQVQLIANITSGVVPLGVSFIPRTWGLEAAEYRYDFDGNGTVDMVTASEETVSCTYEFSDNYTASLTVVDAAGSIYTANRMIIVRTKAEIDSHLMGKITDMGAALGENNIPRAILHFMPGRQETYSRIFGLIPDALPVYAQELSTVRFQYARGNVARYILLRDEIINGQAVTKGYYIYFTLDGAGRWKIEAM